MINLQAAEELLTIMERFAKSHPKGEVLESEKFEAFDRRQFLVSQNTGPEDFVYSTNRTGAKSGWRVIDRDLMVEMMSETIENALYKRVMEVAKNPRAYE